MQGKEIMAHDPWATYERYEEMMNALDNLQISNECMEKLIKLSKDIRSECYPPAIDRPAVAVYSHKSRGDASKLSEIYQGKGRARISS